MGYIQALYPSPYPRVCSSSCPMSQWCCTTMLSSVISFSFCLQSFPASRSFPKIQLFVSGGQSIAASASSSVPPMNIKHWFHLELTGVIPLLSKEFLRDFSNNTVQKHQFFSAQPSLWSNSHIHTWPQEKPEPWLEWGGLKNIEWWWGVTSRGSLYIGSGYKKLARAGEACFGSWLQERASPRSCGFQ